MIKKRIAPVPDSHIKKVIIMPLLPNSQPIPSSTAKKSKDNQTVVSPNTSLAILNGMVLL